MLKYVEVQWNVDDQLMTNWVQLGKAINIEMQGVDSWDSIRIGLAVTS